MSPTNMSNFHINWRFISEQIALKRCTPVISNSLSSATLFPGKDMVQAWAGEVEYPLPGPSDLSRVAQFLSIERQEEFAHQTKSDYLYFLKQQLFEQVANGQGAEQDGGDDFFANVRSEMAGLSFSQLAVDRLAYPSFANLPHNPISLLALLDLPIYLTTSYHRQLEAALAELGKRPRTEVYSWRERLDEEIKPEFLVDRSYQPDVASPLVFHLHGIDDSPSSLVLTEDDHLEFLVNIMQDFPEADVIPNSVRTAVSSHLLLLLGYDVNSWDLRVLLQGILKDRRRRPRSVAIQITPDEKSSEEAQARFTNYLNNYFNMIKFDIFWGSTQEFLLKLSEKL